MSMIRWAVSRMREGHVPLDGWFPSLGLGFPLFHHYQSLPHILTAFVARPLGIERSYALTTYFLLASWPISVYFGARLLRWDRWAAGAAALMSPLLSSALILHVGYEHVSYVFAGPNLWTQLWAMWLLPIAWGLSWRSVSSGTGYAPAAVACGLVVASHFLTGYLVVLSLAVWAVIRPSDFQARVKRAALVALGTLLVAAWVIVPLLQDSEWVVGGGRSGSVGARNALGMLLAGRLFDMGRAPVISFLLLLGAIVCAMRWQRDERARALIVMGILSLLLFFGRSAWNPLLHLLPFGRALILRRYLIGVHMTGILIAAIGATWLAPAVASWLRRQFPEARPVVIVFVVVAAGVAFLSPAITERERFAARSASFVRVERARERTTGADFAGLVARTRGQGRIYAPTEYRVTLLAARSALANLGSSLIGYSVRVPSVAGRVQQYFDEDNPAHYDLFDARHVILPTLTRPAVTAGQVGSKGKYTLWKVPTSGSMKLIDTAGSVAVRRASFRSVMRRFLESDGPELGVHPSVSFDGRPAGPATIATGQRSAGPRGRIEREEVRPNDGVFRARVTAPRPSVVMLKSSYHPRWTVVVDGRETQPFIVAPGFVAQTVPAGIHDVAFRYRSYQHYVWLFLLAAAAVTTLAVIDRRARHRTTLTAHSVDATGDRSELSVRSPRNRGDQLDTH